MNRLDRALERFVHEMTLGPPNHPPRRRPEMRVPGERAKVPHRTLALTYVLALTLPTATAAMLIPFRADHAQTTAIVLVVPVVLVAARGATGPALVAAGVAGLAYDVLLTAPAMHAKDPAEQEEAANLHIAGVLARSQGRVVEPPWVPRRLRGFGFQRLVGVLGAGGWCHRVRRRGSPAI